MHFDNVAYIPITLQFEIISTRTNSTHKVEKKMKTTVKRKKLVISNQMKIESKTKVNIDWTKVDLRKTHT